ncbi:MAG: NAD(P)/FAD-dependent oxidoreductase [Hyphomonadaceae bacterium]|nr:NAD(P)/FAD-dependent oxidoreductase [Hyphomonadaceae bacterium]
MSAFDTDVVIVGAGVVGLACARSLATRGLSVIVLERARQIGAGVSSRNSEVIHAGLHYPTGSWKARLCVAGRRLLYDYLPIRGVAFEKSQKLIVATNEAEIPLIEALARQGETNGVEGLRMIGAQEARALEPNLQCLAALFSAESGILDVHGLLLALQGEIEEHGGAIALESPFERAMPIAGGFSVEAGGATITTPRLVLAAGLQAQSCAAKIEGFPSARIPKLHFGKGNYFALSGKAPFKRLIYPPPIPGALGLHYKRDLGGRAHFGPDLHFVAEENYEVEEDRLPGFADVIRRFWPGLPQGALSPDFAGIRPKLHGPGEKQPDFVIDSEHGLSGLVALFGIESPGLTSSLAIGEEVAQRLI